MRMRILLAVAALMAISTPALAIDECSGGNRAARKLSCVVDGDTIWHRGVKMRLLDIDAPETSGAQCDREREIGKQATRKLQQLMARGYQVEDGGKKDRTSDRRSLVRLRLPDGRDAGKVLIREGLAQPWPNVGNRWCDGRQGNGR